MKSDQILIKHILESADKISRFVADMTYQQFSNDEKTLSAVVRELMVIGEAASGLSDEFKEKHSKIPFHEAIGMRNRIVHEYWAVDDTVVWKTSTEDVPQLKKLLAEL